MRSPSNELLADKLRKMADILEVQHEDGFRIAAYRRAARTLLELEKPIDEIVRNEGLKGVIALPGIGGGIGAAIVEIVTTGRWNQLDRLSGTLEPEQLFQTIPGIGPQLAAHIHNELNADTLEQLEQAAHDGRLEKVPGVGARRALAIKGALADRLGHRHFQRPPHSSGPPVALLLDVDREYRTKAAQDTLRKIAPRRFNPSGEAWLPVLHASRDGCQFTALFSNTQRAHELRKTNDWVVVYFQHDSEPEAQCTIVTETRGPLEGKRVVRGREGDCIAHYAEVDRKAARWMRDLGATGLKEVPRGTAAEGRASMTTSAGPRRIVIMGAAGRDFHNFNVVYRDDPASEVVAFTAAQIPGIADRRYPVSLAGPRYPDGIPILDERDLAEICTREDIDEVVFAYSDVEHAHVMHKASIALAAGADFTLLGPKRTMLEARVPVVAVSAVRTGVGKSQVARWLSRRLKERGLRVVAVRHPMPYGHLERQVVQRFERLEDLDAAQCTVEEREEYEPHLAMGNLVYAGADYGRIFEAAEKEADIILWDGGNNDFPFVRPSLHIVLVDPLRPGHETTHHPGEAVLRMADVVIVAKCNSASTAAIQQVIETARAVAPNAEIIRGASIITLDAPAAVRGKRVIVIDDGPTLTHGGMAYGAGYLAAVEAGAGEIVDPRASAVGHIAAAFKQYPHIGNVLPALGYSQSQLDDLKATINGSQADVVVSGTPSDLARLIAIDKPVVRARYEFAEVDSPRLDQRLATFLQERGTRQS